VVDETNKMSGVTDSEQRRETKIYDTQTLFDNSNEIILRHENQDYRIRITRNGKLIMNK
jgi:hemin uptake protein HemP